ncbi:sigma-54 dependent transcriptional regulator [Vibrio sp.]|nr:sigma-54 dependent transcriptional regulator [Vibrio sp.]
MAQGNRHTDHKHDLQNALLAISQSFSDRSQLSQTLDAILTAASQMTFAQHGIIYVLDQTGTTLTPNIVHHKNKVMLDHPWLPIDLSKPNNNDPFNYAVTSGEVVLINELYQYNGYQCQTIYENELLLGALSQNLLAWPLIDVHNNTVGLLVLFELGQLDNQDALTAFCQLAANTIRQAIWLEENMHIIKELSQDNAQLKRENQHLKARKKPDYSGPIAESQAMIDVLSRLDKILTLPVDVLLRGETGTGKEVIANFIHSQSNRSTGPLIVQNCAAIPEQLLESELFGHKKGAFTGADKDKMGLFEAADGGTLFLDEIGDMPLLLQAKLLRVLQERKVRPIGATKEIEVNVRVIAATHCQLQQKIKKGEFRADLFYRLNVFPISLPALRERKEDILPLAEFFTKQSAANLGLPQAPGLSACVQKSLLEYHYPGNVRELKNIVERALLLSDFETISDVELGDLDDIIPFSGQDSIEREQPLEIVTSSQEATDYSNGLKALVNDYEKTLILNCLRTCNWQTKIAAEQLGLAQSTLNMKIRKMELLTE